MPHALGTRGKLEILPWQVRPAVHPTSRHSRFFKRLTARPGPALRSVRGRDRGLAEGSVRGDAPDIRQERAGDLRVGVGPRVLVRARLVGTSEHGSGRRVAAVFACLR
jgi:hypothetical protein